MDTNTLEMTAEITPNPNTLKFNVNKTLIASGSLNYPDKEKAKGSLLAEKLFEIENVIGVMVGQDFITITKAPAAAWKPMAPTLTKRIKSLLSQDQALFPKSAPAAGLVAGASVVGDTGDIEKKIQAVLDNEIRPAVAMDGGDIIFYGYRDGVVTLHLQGSCSSCPSSIMTLKMGVENRLKSLIPEVREVNQV